MTDDVAPPTSFADPSSATEPTTPVPPSEPAPSPVEPAPVVEPAKPAAPMSIVPEESQSAPEPIAEPPEVEISAPESQSTTSTTTSTPQQQSPASSSSQSVPSAKWSATNRAHAVAKRVGRKEVHLAKVIELAKEKGLITNDNIEKLLHVSDATASRYGTILVRRGLLRREGKGRSARYSAVLLAEFTKILDP